LHRISCCAAAPAGSGRWLAGAPLRPRTLRVRDVRELGGWTPVDSTVPPAPPFRRYDWMDR
jgi:hypothetical protein